MLKFKQYKISVQIEFNKINEVKTEKAIALVSNYISKIIHPEDEILADLQRFEKGYRLRYNIVYKELFRAKAYTKQLAKLSDWLLDEKGNTYGDCLSSYQYNNFKV